LFEEQRLQEQMYLEIFHIYVHCFLCHQKILKEKETFVDDPEIYQQVL
jgi:hypothetical protein